jgi:hypothetical protein
VHTNDGLTKPWIVAGICGFVGLGFAGQEMYITGTILLAIGWFIGMCR